MKLRSNFRADLERAAQDGSEWQFGAVPVDLAPVPTESRVMYLPRGVLQYNNLMDTNGCASRGPLNILETKLDYFYDHGMHPAIKEWLDANGYRADGKFALNDAFIEILSNTTPTGNSLKAPIDAIRVYGVIPAKLIPLQDGMTWPQYMDKKRITDAHLELGRQFLRRLSINYEQVPVDRFDEANEVDLLDTALHAWSVPQNNIYPATDEPVNHCVARVDDGITIFDNYEPFIKKLAKDYKFFPWGYSLSITAQNPYPDETIALFDVLQKNGLLAFFAEAVRRLIAAYAPGSLETAPGDPIPSVPAPTPSPTPTAPHEQPRPHQSRILDWALAIKAGEGADPTSHNPGNLKFSSLTASWGAAQGRKASDGGYLCQFTTDAKGMVALCNFLTLGAQDELRDFHKARTLQAFMTVYGGNPPQGYIDRIAQTLQIPLSTDVSELL